MNIRVLDAVYCMYDIVQDTQNGCMMKSKDGGLLYNETEGFILDYSIGIHIV